MPMFTQMKAFTEQRDEQTLDEIWLLEHQPVYTQGQAGKAEHILNLKQIPIVQADRGGQVTYHGPGQLMMYTLLDIKRRKLGVRQLVSALEQTIVLTLAESEVEAYAKADAPGVYVQEQKICSVGLRIRKGCSFHGLAFNVNMDLTPFQGINPCGYAGMQMVDSARLGAVANITDAKQKLVHHFCALLDIKTLIYKEGNND